MRSVPQPPFVILSGGLLRRPQSKDLPLALTPAALPPLRDAVASGSIVP